MKGKRLNFLCGNMNTYAIKTAIWGEDNSMKIIMPSKVVKISPMQFCGIEPAGSTNISYGFFTSHK